MGIFNKDFIDPNPVLTPDGGYGAGDLTAEALADAKLGTGSQVSAAEWENISNMPMKEYYEWRKLQTPEKLAEVDAALAAVDESDTWDAQQAEADELMASRADPTVTSRNDIQTANIGGILGQLGENVIGRQRSGEIEDARGGYADKQSQVAALLREMQLNKAGNMYGN